jgi:VWFA-related protein
VLKTSALLIAVAAAFSGSAQSPTLIRVPVRVVTVPTAVLSNSGQYVRGLQPGDFRLFDNDHSQNLRLDYVDEPLSIAIAVQNNDAVRASLPAVRRVPSVVEALLLGETGDASLSTFGDEVKLIQPATASSALLDKAFQSISASGSNNRCLDAVVSTAQQLERVSSRRRRVILLIAQSGDTGSMSNLRDVLQELELNNIAVYSLVMPRLGKDLVKKTIAVQGVYGTGIMGSVDLGKLVPEIYRAGKAGAGQDELTIVTSETGGRQIRFRNLHDLETGISAIGEELHTEYLLSYTPDRDEPGYHRIRVQAERPGVVVRARPGYYVSGADVQ